MIPDSNSAHLSQSFQVKPKVALERRALTLSEESLPTLPAQQSSGTTGKVLQPAVCFSTKVSLNDLPFIRSAQKNAQHKSSNGAAVEKVPPASHPESHVNPLFAETKKTPKNNRCESEKTRFRH